MSAILYSLLLIRDEYITFCVWCCVANMHKAQGTMSLDASTVGKCFCTLLCVFFNILTALPTQNMTCEGQFLFLDAVIVIVIQGHVFFSYSE